MSHTPETAVTPTQTARGGSAKRVARLLFTLPCLLILASAGAAPARAQAPKTADIQRLFDPPVVRLVGESRIVRSAQLDAVCPDRDGRAVLEAWLTNHGVVVLNEGQAGLALHYYVEGIEAMTVADRIWEGLPRKADSLQALVDHAITHARTEHQPIRQIIITGHAGLPGCAALGGTLDDCVFNGNLTGYQRRQLIRLRPYLADDAQIELRQCVTGFGKEGQRLLTALHDLTGATASSYLSDFHFGDSAAHPRVQVNEEGLRHITPKK